MVRSSSRERSTQYLLTSAPSERWIAGEDCDLSTFFARKTVFFSAFAAESPHSSFLTPDRSLSTDLGVTRPSDDREVDKM